uniref:Uncharacterized protein n=1 Tax=Opuntia streptacantha TaxID=393608 RepID=A0A7C9FGE4_OPUST
MAVAVVVGMTVVCWTCIGLGLRSSFTPLALDDDSPPTGDTLSSAPPKFWYACDPTWPSSASCCCIERPPKLVTTPSCSRPLFCPTHVGVGVYPPKNPSPQPPALPPKSAC